MGKHKIYNPDLEKTVFDICKVSPQTSITIAKKLNDTPWRIRKWRKLYPAFDEAIKNGNKEFYNF